MKCIVCGNEEFEIIKKGTRDRSDIDVCRCKYCGGNQLSTFEQITDGFYENSGMHQDTLIADLSTLRDIEDSRRRAELFKKGREGQKLLDFGCGAGSFLRLLREEKTAMEEICGVELEDSMRDFLNKEGIRCEKYLKNYSEKYDIITMFHVIEHLTNPYEILQEIKSSLADGGELLIETPNADDALITLYESEAFKDFTYWGCHVFLYTSKSLELLLEKAGFQINYSTQIQRYPLSNHLYWLSKNKPGGHNIWNHMNTEELNKAYYELLKEKQLCDTLLISAKKI